MRQDLEDKVKQWFMDRNLQTANPVKQFTILMEEAGELYEGLAKGQHIYQDKGEKIYLTPNMMEVNGYLNAIAIHKGLSAEACLEMAYEEIKDRKGKMIDGVFVKEADL